MRLKYYMNEAAAVKGFAYESDIIEKIKTALPKLKVKELGAGADSHSPDLVIEKSGKKITIELKLNKNAQMGGTSIRYTSDKKLSFVEEVDPIIEAAADEFFKEKSDAFAEFFKFIREFHPEGSKANWYDGNANAFPLTCTKSAWEAAVSEGKLKPLNAKIQYNTDFIAAHYKKKGVDYIQIGGAGLFYLSSDSANLGVPKLEGNVNIEVRAGRSGSKEVKSAGEKGVGAGIRIQGRLKVKNKSPLSLDNEADIQKLFG